MKTPSLQKAFLTLLVCIVASINSFAQFGGGSGTEEDPYRIYTKEHFEEFANEYNSLNFELYGDFSGIHLRLMNDITDTVKTTLHMIDPDNETGFNGYFHGGGHSINIAPDENSTPPVLFGKIGENGYLDSLEIIGTPYYFTSMVYFNYGIIYHCICNVSIIPPIYPYGSIAGICTANYGLIESCINLSDFTNAIHPDTGWWDNYYFGGICMVNNGIIKKCHNKGDLFSKEALIGGIVNLATNNSLIEHCINSGNISSDNITPDNGSQFAGIAGTIQENSIIRNCINMGDINFLSGLPAGGFFCESGDNGIVENCLNTGRVYGHVGEILRPSGGGIGGILASNDFVVRNCLNIGNSIGGGLLDSLGNPINFQNITQNYYDKQMCLSKGIAGEDVPGSAEGKLTTQLTGTGSELQAMLGTGWSYAEGRYPIPLGLENDSMALVAATPVYLHFETEEDYNHVDSVSRNFTVGLENNVSWDETNGRVSFSGENVTLLNIGMETLTVNLGDYSKKVRINILDTETSNILETITEKGIIIYPNPASDYININLNGMSADKMEICDITGKVISSQFIATELSQSHIKNLKPGMYLLKIYNKNQNVTTLRFVKN